MPLYGYAPDQRLSGLLGGSDYSGYDPNGLQFQGYGNGSGSSYDPDLQAAVAARTAAAPDHDSRQNAPAFQPQNPNDPYYQRSDIAPAIQATNRDVMGGGNYGVRGWMRDHPIGTMAVLAALTATGGALAAPGAAAGAGEAGAAAGAGGGGAGGAGGLGSAAGGLQSSSGLGFFANGGAGGMTGVGGGNAGLLASSGGITGGAGQLIGSGGLLGSGAIKNASSLSSLLGGGDSGGQSTQMPYMGFGSNYGQPSQQQPTPMMGSAPQRPILPGMPQQLPQAVGRRPYQFHGTTIWM